MIRIIIIVAVMTSASIHASCADPFVPGFGMANQNTIIWKNSPTARQPWIAAAYFADESVPLGFAAGAVSYYADFGSLTDITQGMAGLWCTRKGFTLKASYRQLDALDQYYRQRGFLSFGMPLYVPGVRISMEAELFRCGLADTTESEAYTTIGWTAVLRRKAADISVSCSHIMVEQASDDSFEPPLTFSALISTARHRYGAQGIGFDYIMEHRTRFRFRLGHGFWIHQRMGMTFSMATNPTTLGVGIELDFPVIETGAAYLYHPVLGWSRGVHIMYPWRRHN
ncbi:MAG: hypothetical protein ACOCW2_01350 [Chitinivibrionales bacterium]